MFLKLRHIAAQSFGKLLSRVPFNELEKRHLIEGAYYHKKRCWYAPLLIIAGNAYLRLLRTHVRMLFLGKWLMWERRVYKELLGMELQPGDGQTLVMPYLEGSTLCDILRSDNGSDAEKLEVIALTVRTIKAMHKCQIIWPDGEKRYFSHGDLTVKNVVCDLVSGSCFVIDYETIHDAKMSSEWRHADDLRTIIYSAAECIEPHLFSQLCRVTIGSYSDKSVLGYLKSYVKISKLRPNVYHLAQSPLGFEKKCSLDVALLCELDLAGF